MNTSTGLTGTIIQAFSWMLVHSLWQGLLLALIAAFVLLLTKKTVAAARYGFTLVLFSVFLLAAVGTFVYEYNSIRRENIQAQSVGNFHPVIKKFSGGQQRPVFLSPVIATKQPANASFNIKGLLTLCGNYFSANSLWIVILWFIFFAVKSVSMAGNMLYMHRARRYRVFDAGDYWNERIAALSRELKLKRVVTLLESAYIQVPVVIGYFKPVILVPVGLIAGIPAAQVEAVLLHELAHIRRNDYIVNFIQHFAEAMFFFNPGLLWISARLRDERENCCDDMAIAQTNNKEAYVQALIGFKEYTVSAPAYAMAFSGQKNSLINRVMRIVYQENKTLSIKENGILIAAIAMLSLMAFTIYPLKNSIGAKAHTAKSIKSTAGVARLPVPTTPIAGASNTKIDEKDRQASTMSTVAFDSTKVSAISGIEKVGPNFIAIIDDKEYPKEILYKISNSCIGGMAIFRPDYGLQKYGPKASDGYIQIRTRHGEITYMSAIERENLIKEYSIPKSKFYNRIALKKEDGSFDNDRIVMNVMPDGAVAGNLPHDGKAAFYIDKNFYTEETIQKVSPAIIASLTGEYGVQGSDPTIPREKGYTLIFDFHTNKTGLVAPTSSDTVSPKNSFLVRLVLKDKTGQLYDQIVIHDPSGNAITTLDVSHNGKVGYYIDKDFYEEEDIKKLSSAMLASLSGGGGCRPPDLRIDRPGYESIFDFTTKKYALAIMKDTVTFNAAKFAVGKNAPISAVLELIPGIKVSQGGAIFYKDLIVTKLFLNNTPYAGEGIEQGIQSLPADIVEKIKIKPSIEDNGRAIMINLITKGRDHLAAPVNKGSRYATWDDY